MNTVKISSLQMAMLMYPTIVATAILSVPSITATYAKQDLWISPIFASIIGFLTVYISVSLHNHFPEKTVIQFSEQIIGRIPGKILGLVFLFFYIHSAGDITRAYAEFIVSSFLFQTPIIVVIVTMVLLCAFAVYGGLEVLGRISQLLFPLFFVPLLLLILLLSPDFEIGNIFPILEKGIIPPIKGAIVPSGWFSEIFMIIFFLPFLTDKKKGRKYGVLTVLAVMITLVVVNLIVLFILGTTTSSKSYPLMNISRYVSIADFFENLESVTMAIWILGTFVKISVFFYVVVLGTAQWLNIEDYRPIVWPIGILIVEFSFWAVPSSMAFIHYEITAFPFYSVTIQTIIPLLLLGIAFFKNRNRKKESNSVYK
ncbi:GerAB/ArcD/ProY family transporter [Cytobacillus dafuensis]|uniref:GerAB/ArcD/ProY family transporter n=1 Tax=Cytobacillus dafuensis TaxID=1742359 RepID=A0A5B8Z2M8_CYTDA|nr:endospore germination permease [Cytobacillus dafuensis]QED47285.1 GerAB/ArcD/ProY family transporter [Cytobacillus dafuensis]